MKDVSIYIDTDMHAPRGKIGHYGYVLEYDSGKNLYTAAEIGCLKDTTSHRLELAALYQAVMRIRRKWPITIHTNSLYLKSAFEKWLVAWKRDGWCTARGREIKNKDLWEKVHCQIGDRNVNVIYIKEHAYSKWLQMEMERAGDLEPGKCRGIQPE